MDEQEEGGLPCGVLALAMIPLIACGVTFVGVAAASLAVLIGAA
ncbi:MAG: hypothetical protein SF162_17785 [bacterium]|nr:hypothetical protein [bacterium]